LADGQLGGWIIQNQNKAQPQTEFELGLGLSLVIADLVNALFGLICKVKEPLYSFSSMSQVPLTDIQSQNCKSQHTGPL